MTRYADKLMTSGEVIILRARQHWAALLLMARRAFLVWIIAAIAIAVYAVARPERELATVLGLVILVLMVLGALIFLFNLWHWWSQDYLVTNRRVMKVEGIINKNAADSSLEKINDATLHQNLFGRMLNYGDLDILTAADTAVDRFGMLAGAPEFKRQMLQQKYALETEHAYRQTPTPPLRSDDRAASRRPMAEEQSPTPATVTDDGFDGGDVGRSGMGSVGMTGGGLGAASLMAESRVATDDDQASAHRDPTAENATSTWALESAAAAPTASSDAGGAVTTGAAGSSGSSVGAAGTPMAGSSGGTAAATSATEGTAATGSAPVSVGSSAAGATGTAPAPTPASGSMPEAAASSASAPEPAAAPAPAPPAAKPADAAEITATLARLADLRDRGAISAEEYDGKKRELLDRL